MDQRKSLLLLAGLLLTVVLVLCGLGILATLEPLEEGRATTWRFVYGTAGALSILGLLLIVRRFRGHPR